MLTRFELMTVAALLHFSDEGVDVAVVEVGMGGTWDSTNVIDSDVAVLTNVDLDHTAVLGNTVGEIATDKVGIFRADAVNVVATTNAIVVEIARNKAEDSARRCGFSARSSIFWRTSWHSVVERSRCARRMSPTTRSS